MTLLLVLFLPACGPVLTPTTLPTPAALVVQRTPALEPLTDAFSTCTEELNNTGLVLLEKPAAALDVTQSAIALRWGMQGTPPGYAAIVGQEELVIIVNPKNQLQSLSLSDVQAIYQGQQRSWTESGGQIELWAYPSGDDARQVFMSVIMGGQPIAENISYTAPDPAAMLQAVAASSNAIGFLPRRWLNNSVRGVPMQGLDAAKLRQPVVAMAKSEPNGPEKSWLLCLQEHMSE